MKRLNRIALINFSIGLLLILIAFGLQFLAFVPRIIYNSVASVALGFIAIAVFCCVIVYWRPFLSIAFLAVAVNVACYVCYSFASQRTTEAVIATVVMILLFILSVIIEPGSFVETFAEIIGLLFVGFGYIVSYSSNYVVGAVIAFIGVVIVILGWIFSILIIKRRAR